MRVRPSRSLLALALFGASTLVAPAPADAQTPPPVPLNVHVTGANGAGRATLPGLSCAEGGDGASWHYAYEANLPGGAGGFTGLPTSLRLNLDVHGEPPAAGGFLQGNESTVSLVNERGTVVLRLSDGGDCDHRTATVSTTQASTTGTWEVASGTGAFETATGSGNFTVTAGIAPGADNPFTLDLTGGVSVAAPSLTITKIRSWWGNVGLDFVLRQPTVQYLVTNTGTGDAFGVNVTGAASTTPGVVAIAGVPVGLGDLAPGESGIVTVRYRLDLLGPCALVILGCKFNAVLHTSMTDGLDRTLTEVDSLLVETPLLAPGL